MLTNGWDTVFVADIEEINKDLATSIAKLLPAFSFTDAGFSAAGALPIWQIVPGGSNGLLFLQITTGAGQMQEGGQSLDISGIELTYTVSLKLLPAPNVAQGQQLIFNFAAYSSAAGNQSGVVGPVRTTAPPGRLTTLQEAALCDAVGKSLAANSDKIAFVFATINPLAAAGVSWLEPRLSAYGYADVIGSSRHWLAILSVNTDRAIDKLPLELDPSLLGAQDTVGLAISQNLFLQNMFIPPLASALNTAPAHLGLGEVPGKGPGIIATHTFHLKPIEKSGRTYTPRVTWVHAVVADSQIELSLGGDCDMGMNITMNFNSSTVLRAIYDPATSGVSFKAVGKPAFDKTVTVPWYDVLLDACTFVGLAILAMTLTSVDSELSSAISRDSSVGRLVAKAPALVNWLERTGFTPTDGGLATSFYLRGRL